MARRLRKRLARRAARARSGRGGGGARRARPLRGWELRLGGRDARPVLRGVARRRRPGDRSRAEAGGPLPVPGARSQRPTAIAWCAGRIASSAPGGGSARAATRTATRSRSSRRPAWRPRASPATGCPRRRRSSGRWSAAAPAAHADRVGRELPEVGPQREVDLGHELDQPAHLLSVQGRELAPRRFLQGRAGLRWAVSREQALGWAPARAEAQEPAGPLHLGDRLGGAALVLKHQHLLPGVELEHSAKLLVIEASPRGLAKRGGPQPSPLGRPPLHERERRPIALDRVAQHHQQAGVGRRRSKQARASRSRPCSPGSTRPSACPGVAERAARSARRGPAAPRRARTDRRSAPPCPGPSAGPAGGSGSPPRTTSSFRSAALRFRRNQAVPCANSRGTPEPRAARPRWRGGPSEVQRNPRSSPPLYPSSGLTDSRR